MDNIKSKYNTLITLDYIQNNHENKYFDLKSVRIKTSDLAQHISAFANADGGVLVIGVDDQTRNFEGVNSCGDQLYDFISAPKDYCKPMPAYHEEFLPVINKDGEEDRILLLHIEPSVEQVIRTKSDTIYLRISDRSKEIKGDDLRNLEYSKNVRAYESEINTEATLDDLDEQLIQQYKQKIGATHLTTEKVFKARGLMKNKDGVTYLTNAAVLLFAKCITQFNPNCRIRFLRYDGTEQKYGIHMNIIKDYTIEDNLINLIDKAKFFISIQLRDFTTLDPLTGRFKTVHEYPEFAWLEGIINGIIHREYATVGLYIRVDMYDDRLEISSPGKFPDIVTIQNIKEIKYSRNPVIHRVLSEISRDVKLNNGVEMIHSAMSDAFLDEPIFLESNQGVGLILKNNIHIKSRK